MHVCFTSSGGFIDCYIKVIEWINQYANGKFETFHHDILMIRGGNDITRTDGKVFSATPGLLSLSPYRKEIMEDVDSGGRGFGLEALIDLGNKLSSMTMARFGSEECWTSQNRTIQNFDRQADEVRQSQWDSRHLRDMYKAEKQPGQHVNSDTHVCDAVHGNKPTGNADARTSPVRTI